MQADPIGMRGGGPEWKENEFGTWPMDECDSMCAIHWTWDIIFIGIFPSKAGRHVRILRRLFRLQNRIPGIAVSHGITWPAREATPLSLSVTPRLDELT
ncbi:MAG: hypothetical protein E6G92_01840 [Alphaproteobacteria bacterium]|nr:MAG: hypothetical protein E6G92_01840 [Alphaproteobacteria bacterium]